tara:strand:- start:2395 stop:3099 length:705 start_codon:yes stop_codon:yes gene_type:complete
MENGSDNFELIILALVAAFIILQLRRVLGRKTGYDGSDEKDRKTYGRGMQEKDNVVPMRRDPLDPYGKKENSHAEENPLGVKRDSPFYETLSKIREYDRNFSLHSFLDGAEMAYGMILQAFWSGDKTTLRNMLSKDVYGQFVRVLEDMQQKGLHFDNVLRDVEKIDLKEATLTGSVAELTLEFTSHMVLATKDSEGRIIEGDVTEPVRVVDIWTFCRDVKRSDPNWTLVATRNG